MRKQILSFLLTASILTSGGLVAFAAEAEQAEEIKPPTAIAEIVPNNHFTGSEIQLTLEDVKKRITTTGPGFENAVLSKEATETQALESEEMWYVWRNTRSLLSRYPSMMTNPITNADAKRLEKTRAYLTTQASIVYEIDLNNLEYSAVSTYYNTLLAQENLRIQRENLTIQQDILANTHKKFELGVVAKMDVLQAESAVKDAEIEVQAAETALKSAKMKFNMDLGYPLMQNITLTDTLERKPKPSQPLVLAINNALKNRNELRQLDFVLDNAKAELEKLWQTSKYKAEYINAELAIKETEKTIADAKAGIELDIRVKFMTLADLEAEITALELTIANAKEAYRLASLSFDAGLNTLVEVQNVQLLSQRAQLGMAGKLKEYNMALYELEYAVGYGMNGSSSMGSGGGSNAGGDGSNQDMQQQ